MGEDGVLVTLILYSDLDTGLHIKKQARASGQLTLVFVI